jgi:Lsr2 protein
MPRIPRVPQPETASTPLERIQASLGEPTPAVEPVAVPEPTNAELREWARANSHDVSDSGPIPKAVREAYSAAHGG